jgi:hypothetical protein
VAADGLPAEVALVLRDVYGECELVEGLFEKETPCPRAAAPARQISSRSYAPTIGIVVGVEGKVAEPFGTTVAEWNDGSPGKRARLADLCERLGLDPTAVDELRYQLLHRTLATLLEANRYGVSDAVMLVHSFHTRHASLADYAAFADALRLTGAAPGRLTSPTTLDGITLRLGWVRSSLSG